MSNIANNILNSIDLIVEKRLQDADYDKTIKAEIIEQENVFLNRYRAKYQEAIILVYGQGDTQYHAGDQVYVLVPKNDMSLDKQIVGMVKSGTPSAPSVNSEKSYYNTIGDFTISNNSFIITTNSANSVMILFDENTDKLNIRGFLETLYKDLNKASALMLSGTFQTEFQFPFGNNGTYTNNMGNYGLRFYFSFYTDINKINVEEKIFTLDINDFIGDPYLLLDPTVQFKAYNDLKGYLCKELTKIELFAEGFEESSNIHVSNINLQPGYKTGTQNDGTSLSITAPNENSFIEEDQEGIWNTDILPLEVMLYIDGNQITDKVKYYWFQARASIGLNHELYNPYGGLGWACLNTKDEESGKWKSGEYIYKITRESLNTYSNRFKCVAIYEDARFISNEIEILKIGNGIWNLVIEESVVSANASKFTCLIYNGNELQEPADFNYKWYTRNIYNELKSITDETSNQYIDYNISSIIKYKDYICEVFQGETLLGEAIFRKEYGDTENYIVSIKNGTQVFLFDEIGALINSPQELTAQVVAPNGRMLEPDEFSVQWRRGGDNTTSMISRLGALNENEPDLQNISNANPLQFSLQRVYTHKRSSNNFITLTVTIPIEGQEEPLKFTEVTQFSFIKKGNAGTNGTNYLCKIIPVQTEDQINTFGYNFVNYYMLSNQDIQYSEDGKHLYFDEEGNSYTEPGNDRVKRGEKYPLKAMLFKADLEKEVEPTSIFYTIWGSSNTIRVENDNDQAWIYIYDVDTKPNFNNGYDSNIVQAIVKYKDEDDVEQTAYAYLPIVTKWGEDNFDLISNSGFYEVLYTSDGKNPIYDNGNRFKLDTKLNGIWSIAGEKPILSIAEQDDALKTCLVTSKDRVTTSLKDNAIIWQSGENLLHIPVIVLLNRYEYANINNWDGDVIAIDQEGTSILAPQAGFGKKENGVFTGVVLGEVATNNEKKTGLFAYGEGEQSFALDADNGNLIIGKLSEGFIEIKPGSAPIIQSGNYINNQSGMKINLSNYPSIEWGNGNFRVDSNGILTAKRANIEGNVTIGAGASIAQGATIAGWRINEYGLISSNNLIQIYGTGDDYSFIQAGLIGTNSYTRIDSNGKITAKGGHFDSITANNFIFNSGSIAENVSIGGKLTGASAWEFTDLEILNGSDNSAAYLVSGSMKVYEDGWYLNLKSDATTEYPIFNLILNSERYDGILEKQFSFNFMGASWVNTYGLKRGLRTFSKIYQNASYEVFFNSQFYQDPANTTIFQVNKSSKPMAYIRPTGDAQFQQITCTTCTQTNSDENVKNSIEPLADAYSVLFDNLEAVTYKYNYGTSDRTHTGFIVQPTLKAMEKANLTTQDFAAVCYRKEDKTWGLRYEEFIALNTDQIQKAKKRIAQLEAQNADYEQRLARLELLVKGEINNA